MEKEFQEYYDLFIERMKNPLDVFKLQKLIPAEIKFTIGGLARRVRELKIPELKDSMTAAEMAELMNQDVRTIERKIELLDRTT